MSKSCRFLSVSCTLLLITAIVAQTSLSVSEASPYLDGSAPNWPFQGIIQYEGILEIDEISRDVPNKLIFRDARTGETSEVTLGSLSRCWVSPVASETHVDLGGWGDIGNVRYLVPWGDEAYPILDAPAYGNRVVDVRARPYVDKQSLAGRLDVSWVSGSPGLVRVATPSEEAFYNMDLGYGGEFGLLLNEAPLGVTNRDDGEVSDDWAWEPWAGLIGTDGFYYGIGVFSQEPTCARQTGFLVAGDTGEVVACESNLGPALNGLAFVFPDGSSSFEGDLALPLSVDYGECNELDIGVLRSLPLTASRQAQL